MAELRYEYSVFINCPFDDAYRSMFRALVFAVHDCGYAARSALEVSDASEVRIEKISRIILACKFGIHDISRTELDETTMLPRFNMPLELGLFIGAKRFGTGRQRMKTCLVLDVERHRYQKFISDIAGQDISSHGGTPLEAIRLVRNWLSDAAPKPSPIPGGTSIAKRYDLFQQDLPTTCAKVGLDAADLTFTDYVMQVEEWLDANAYVPG
jgi:hypothetical protein